jgi:hypothetical protein
MDEKEAIFDSHKGRLCLVTSERVRVTSNSLKASAPSTIPDGYQPLLLVT